MPTSPPTPGSTAAGELVTAAGSRTVSGALITTDRTVALTTGSRLSIEVDPGRWCLGRRRTDGASLLCPDGARVTTGRQCARCESDDPWRWLHIVHRSQFPPDAALREHVQRPHWLYVATFAGGAQKVGTAVDERKQARLDEQGAVFAHWVALAADGLEVREWEDLVSRSTPVGQVVRPAAKAAGLATTVDLAGLAIQHDRTVARVGEVLAETPGADPFAEAWPNPRDPDSLSTLVLRPYPGTLGQGRHGFTFLACWGPVGLVGLDGDPESAWAVDLSALTGHRIRFGEFSTAVPQIQDGLF